MLLTDLFQCMLSAAAIGRCSVAMKVLGYVPCKAAGAIWPLENVWTRGSYNEAGQAGQKVIEALSLWPKEILLNNETWCTATAITLRFRMILP
jgi:hypothetical protein